MPSYSMKRTKNNRVLYYKDNHLVAKADIPEDVAIVDKDYEMPPEPQKRAIDVVAEHLNNDVFIEGYKPLTTLEPAPPAPPAVSEEVPAAGRDCLVCGEKGTRMRFFNGNTVRLCEDHYMSLTLGEIAATLREKVTM